MCCKLKKFLKVITIIAGVVGAIVGIYMVVTKFLEKKNAVDDPENYVSCSCCDEDAVAMAEEPAAE